MFPVQQVAPHLNLYDAPRREGGSEVSTSPGRPHKDTLEKTSKAFAVPGASKTKNHCWILIFSRAFECFAVATIHLRLLEKYIVLTETFLVLLALFSWDSETFAFLSVD